MPCRWFRLADLDAMIAQLKSADIEVSHESEMGGHRSLRPHPRPQGQRDRALGAGGVRRASLPSGDAEPHSDPSRLVPRSPNPRLGLALLTNGLCDATDEDHRAHPDQSSDPRRLGDRLGLLAH